MKVVVGVSGSPLCAAAVRAAWEAAVAHEAPLLVLAVWQAPAVPDYAGLGQVPQMGSELAEATRLQAWELVAEATSGLPGSPEVTVESSCGSAGPALVALVGPEDLLFVGAPRPGWLHRLAGSVANYLLTHAPCPVTVVPGAARVLVPH